MKVRAVINVYDVCPPIYDVNLVSNKLFADYSFDQNTELKCPHLKCSKYLVIGEPKSRKSKQSSDDNLWRPADSTSDRMDSDVKEPSFDKLNLYGEMKRFRNCYCSKSNDSCVFPPIESSRRDNDYIFKSTVPSRRCNLCSPQMYDDSPRIVQSRHCDGCIFPSIVPSRRHNTCIIPPRRSTRSSKRNDGRKSKPTVSSRRHNACICQPKVPSREHYDSIFPPIVPSRRNDYSIFPPIVPSRRDDDSNSPPIPFSRVQSFDAGVVKERKLVTKTYMEEGPITFFRSREVIFPSVYQTYLSNAENKKCYTNTKYAQEFTVRNRKQPSCRKCRHQQTSSVHFCDVLGKRSCHFCTQLANRKFSQIYEQNNFDLK